MTTTAPTTRPLTSVERVALTTSTADLRHVINALNIDLLTAVENNVRGTQAHVGMLEMLQVFSRELVLRQGTVSA